MNRPGIWLLVALLLLGSAVFEAVRMAPRMAGSHPALVLYCAQDQVFAEPLLAEFTRTTGIPVRVLYDSEAVKTVGLANRLLAERTAPRADVWWSNEELRTRQLAAAGVFGTNRVRSLDTAWIAFGARHRCLVWRPDQPPPGGPPASLIELTNARWHGRLSLAFPLFGTTATHLLALRAQWGEEAWGRWCQALAANRPFLEEGNSQVARRVARGEAWIGLTDSDDLAVARHDGLPIEERPLRADLLAIPNTVALVRPAGPRETARQLVDFLAGQTVLKRLRQVGALDPESTGSTPPAGLDWDQILAGLDAGTKALEGFFRR